MDNIVLVGRGNNQNNNNNNTRVWGFRNHQGKLLHRLPSHLQTVSPSDYKETLRKNLTVSTARPSTATTNRSDDIRTTTGRITTMRPVRPIPAANGVTSSSTQRSSTGTTNYIPAQAIVTCFYSVNDRFVMNDRNLLDDMDQKQHIPCITVHGGQDPICPIDSALDLWSVYPSMELRIPLQSGHSMYDPAITNELLMATDYFANTTKTQMMYKESDAANSTTVPFPITGPCQGASSCALDDFAHLLSSMSYTSLEEWCVLCENDSADVCLQVKLNALSTQSTSVSVTPTATQPAL
jgi:hypothetical protein